jgi:hypothetical protein
VKLAVQVLYVPGPLKGAESTFKADGTHIFGALFLLGTFAFSQSGNHP